jgi:hypothetical protein
MARKFSLADLPETIPIFPLPGALLLPRARLPLNIFEPRYLAMLDDTLKTGHRLIGMIQPAVGPLAAQEGQEPARLHSIGCAGRVTAFQETEDGRYLITLSGVSRFRLGAFQDGFAPYRRANVDWSSATSGGRRRIPTSTATPSSGRSRASSTAPSCPRTGTASRGRRSSSSSTRSRSSARSIRRRSRRFSRHRPSPTAVRPW